MTITESLQSISSYPMSPIVVADKCEAHGLFPAGQMTEEIRRSSAYKLAKADCYLFLSTAPNVSQGGVSYSLDAETKKYFKSMGKSIYNEVGTDEEGSAGGTVYGYKGDTL